MTIGTNSRNDAVGNGATAVYPYAFKIFDATDLRVTVQDDDGVEAVLSYPAHYTVSGVGSSAGGNVTLSGSGNSWQDGDGDLLDGYRLTIRRVVPLNQTTDIRNQGGYRPTTIEDTFDRTVMQIQQLADELSRSIRVAETSTNVSTLLPAPTPASSLGWNASGDALINIALETGTTLVDLAASTGSALVGFIQSGVDAITQTLQTRLRKAIFSDDYDTLQHALDAAVGRKLIIRGTNNITAETALPVSGYITQEPGASIVLNVSEIGLKIPDNADGLTLDGLVISGTSARPVSTGLSAAINQVKIKNCDISGHTLVGLGYTSGIFIASGTNCTIEENYIHDGGPGAYSGGGGDICFYVGDNQGNHIVRNRCTSILTNTNIQCFDFGGGLIEGNRCSGAQLYGAGNNNGYGILVYENAASAKVKRNRIIGNYVTSTEGSGIYCATAFDIAIEGNVCYTVATTQGDGTLPVGAISLNGCTGAAISGNQINTSGKDGIVLSGCVDISLGANTIKSPSQYGVHVRGTGSKINIEGVTITSSGDTGVYLDATAKTGVSVKGCVITSPGGAGIDAASVSESAFVANTVKSAGKQGIQIAAGSDNTVGLNVVKDCSGNVLNGFDGILVASDRTQVANNVSRNSGATGNRYGININAANCTIEGNQLSNNQTGPIALAGSGHITNDNKYGTGDTFGTATLAAGTVTVSTNEVVAGDHITLVCTGAAGTQGFVRYSISAGNSFTITSSSATDTSVYSWKIEH